MGPFILAHADDCSCFDCRCDRGEEKECDVLRWCDRIDRCLIGNCDHPTCLRAVAPPDRSLSK